MWEQNVFMNMLQMLQTQKQQFSNVCPHIQAYATELKVFLTLLASVTIVHRILFSELILYNSTMFVLILSFWTSIFWPWWNHSVVKALWLLTTLINPVNCSYVTLAVTTVSSIFHIKWIIRFTYWSLALRHTLSLSDIISCGLNQSALIRITLTCNVAH